MKAKSIKGKSPEEIIKALAQSKSDGFNPTLAVVFISMRSKKNLGCTDGWYVF